MSLFHRPQPDPEPKRPPPDEELAPPPAWVALTVAQLYSLVRRGLLAEAPVLRARALLGSLGIESLDCPMIMVTGGGVPQFSWAARDGTVRIRVTPMVDPLRYTIVVFTYGEPPECQRCTGPAALIDRLEEVFPRVGVSRRLGWEY